MKSAFEYIMIFLIGFFSCAVLYYLLVYSGINNPFTANAIKSIEAPSNWISTKDIALQQNKIIISVQNASISNYENTDSMKPTLDENSNGIKIVPESASQIKVGDIVTFRQSNKLIVHRVIEKSTDAEGIYFITKGDNSEFADSKIRFSDIKYVTIGVLW